MTRGRLRGIGWDHPRCVGPVLAATDAWVQAGELAIEWTFRTLAEFNDAPLASLAGEYDLLVIDHPMVANSWPQLQPVDPWIGPASEPDGSVGHSQSSYEWDGHAWAIALDAAVHVSAGRPDLLRQAAEPWPQTWPEVLDLAARREGFVLASLTGDDAVCTLLSVAASLGTPVALDAPVSLTAVEVVTRLARSVPRSCLGYRPPDVLELIKHGHGAFSPALFSYATYLGAPGSRLRYSTVPSMGAGGVGLLGGAGLAVSRACADPAAAGRFCSWISTDEVQRDVIVRAGGQPTSRRVWLDPMSDAATGGFFSQTLAAMDSAFTRPKHPRWSRFQHQAAVIFERGLASEAPAETIHRALEAARGTVAEA